MKKLSKNQAVALLPEFALGLVYNHVTIDVPISTDENATVGLSLNKNKVLLHPDDYSFLQTNVVQFF